MIASRAMILQTSKSLQKCRSSDADDMTSVQLAGCEPDVMAEAAKLNEDLGAKMIDINFGCPVKKVVGGNAGSALMKDEPLAAKILEATVKAVKIPVTLKMRMGWDSEHKNAPQLARIAEDIGIQLITIHGRTRAQMFNGTADWKFIEQVKQAVKIPVIANGDIKSVHDAKQALDDSKADGVMIGRGAYGKPWLINQVLHYLKSGDITSDPTHKQKLEIILEHYKDTIELYGEEAGMHIARKHIGWYTKGIPSSAEFRAGFNQVIKYEEGVARIEEFFDAAITN
jgi:tRNA-dihydrouridine synthase B